MEHLTDQQLLREYIERRSESAFAEIVRRHIDLVYSAALRMVCDLHLAEDVTQRAFLALALNAPTIRNRTVLAGWLHGTAQNLAAKTVRSEVRRRAREQEAVAMNELLSPEPNPGWEQISQHLDHALTNLTEADRDALLLRYFQRKSVRDVAAVLGVSEKAAEKRVSRAVDRLRLLFAKRGIEVGAGGLAGIISMSAVQAAPVGLSTSITTAAALAGTALQSSAVAAVTQNIVMTLAQKTIVTGVVAVAIGVALFERQQASALHARIEILEQQQAPLTGEVEPFRAQSDAAVPRIGGLAQTDDQEQRNRLELARLRSEVGRLRSDAQELQRIKATEIQRDSILVTATAWVAKAEKLRTWIDQHPEFKIPEFAYMNDLNWLSIVRGFTMEEPDALPMSAYDLRQSAKAEFASKMINALRQFAAAHSGTLPNELAELGAYFNPPLSDAILPRYKLLHTGLLTELPKPEWLVVEVAPPLDKYDEADPFVNAMRTNGWSRIRRAK